MKELVCFTRSYDRSPTCKIIIIDCGYQTDDDLISDQSLFTKINTTSPSEIKNPKDDQSLFTKINTSSPSEIKNSKEVETQNTNEYKYVCPFKNDLPKKSFYTINHDHFIDEHFVYKNHKGLSLLLKTNIKSSNCQNTPKKELGEEKQNKTKHLIKYFSQITRVKYFWKTNQSYLDEISEIASKKLVKESIFLKYDRNQ